MKNSKKKRVLILGARRDGHAKVVLEILEATNNYEILGFIDDASEKMDTEIRGYKVLDGTNALVRLKSEFAVDGAIVAIGNNRIRRQLGQRIIEYGLELINAIHPMGFIASDVSIGNGVVCGAGVVINTSSSVGDHVNINTAATVDHDNIIEDGVNISPGVHTSGRVHICRDVFVGTGASFVPDIKVGKGAVVGAGAVVIRDVRPYTIVAGVPAKEIRKLKMVSHG